MSAVCPAYPKQRTFPDPVGTSHLCQERKCAGLRPTAAHSYSPKDAVGPPWVTGESDDQCRTVGRQCGDVQHPTGNDGIASGRGLAQATWRGQIDEPDASLVGRLAAAVGHHRTLATLVERRHDLA